MQRLLLHVDVSGESSWAGAIRNYIVPRHKMVSESFEQAKTATAREPSKKVAIIDVSSKEI